MTDPNQLAALANEKAREAAALQRARFLELSRTIGTSNEPDGEIVAEWQSLAEALGLLDGAAVAATSIGHPATAHSVLFDRYVTPFRKQVEIANELAAAESSLAHGPTVEALQATIQRLENRLAEVTAPIQRDLDNAKNALAGVVRAEEQIAILKRHRESANVSVSQLETVIVNSTRSACSRGSAAHSHQPGQHRPYSNRSSQ